jgi:hypothetical protein
LERGETYEIHVMVTPNIDGLIDEARRYLSSKGLGVAIGVSEYDGIWTIRLGG